MADQDKMLRRVERQGIALIETSIAYYLRLTPLSSNRSEHFTPAHAVAPGQIAVIESL